MSSLSTRKPIILVVDDVAENIALLKKALESRYTVRLATNGHIALKAAKLEPHPDLVLLDIMMPDMDGYEVCRQLKSHSDTRHIPVIFVTGKLEEKDELDGLKLGAADYIRKPVRLPLFMARVETHLTVHLQQRQLESQNIELMEAARLRGEMERIVHHDLKGPLSSIIGFSQLLSAPHSSQEKTGLYAKMIESSAYRLLDMINMSLDIYKMEEGCYTLTQEVVDVRDVLNKVQDGFRSLSESKRTPFVMEFCGHDVQTLILGEELLCYSLFANVLKNSLEASPLDHPIRLSLANDADGLSVTIQNAGAVPESIRTRFFDKFVTCGKNAGTGLGTYSAQLIARLHRGHITMATSEQAGTSVTVHLPLLSKPVPARSVQTSSER